MELLGIARSVTGNEPKCIKCKHYRLYRPDPVLIYSSPKHRCAAAVDLVTGRTIETDCYAMRHRWVECGPDAKLFAPAPPNEEKPPPPPPLPDETDTRKGLNPLLVGFSALAILALIYWAYEQETHQPSVVQTGEVSVKKVSVKDGSCCVTTARTRLLAVGKRWQFEASPGVWEDCGDDCEKALRRKLAK